MPFMMFRLVCKLCDWSVGLTREEDASYSVNFFASHLLDHVAEIVALIGDSEEK